MKDNNTFKSSEEELSDDDILECLKFILCDNEWFTYKEIEKYFTDEKCKYLCEYICECIRECTSPDKTDIFNAFDGLPPKKVKVLILGQDPYPDKEKAHGLAFSHKEGNIHVKDSLKNIFDKIKENVGIDNEFTDLTSWKKKGVLLLNTVLTYAGENNREYNSYAWNPFINIIISKLIEYKIENEKPLVIMLWGKEANELYPVAYKKNKYENCPFIKILRSSHPSNLSCYSPIYNDCLPAFNERNYKPFKECNKFLKANGVDEIDWHTK